MTTTEPVDDANESDDQIKLPWKGDARSKIITRELEPRAESGDETAQAALEAFQRQRTNIVVRSAIEARGLKSALERACHRDSMGTIWLTPMHLTAFRRVRDGLLEAMAERGWDEANETKELVTDGGRKYDCAVCNAPMKFKRVRDGNDGPVVESEEFRCDNGHRGVLHYGPLGHFTQSINLKESSGGKELVTDGGTTVALEKCISCQRFISDDNQSVDGIFCDSCGDEVSAPDMRLNGFEYDAPRDVWVRQIRTDGGMIDFETEVQAALEDAEDSESHREMDPNVFHPSQLVRCPRRAYCSKFGLDDQRDNLGTFQTGTLIHEFLETQLSDRFDDGVVFEKEVETIDPDTGIKIKGRADCVDYNTGTVYDFKTRASWYKFNPPVQRHLDQLHLYMSCLTLTGVDRARVIYLSKKDMEVRQWPSDSLFSFDQARYDALIDKAVQIRDAIDENGIAGSPDEIPFEKCDCYFCSQEALSFK